MTTILVYVDLQELKDFLAGKTKTLTAYTTNSEQGTYISWICDMLHFNVDMTACGRVVITKNENPDNIRIIGTIKGPFELVAGIPHQPV